MKKEFENWLESAKEDLKIAEYNLKGGMLKAAAFYSQQCIEKGLKALYIKKIGKLWKIHDLVEIAKKIEAPDEILESCIKLTPLYVDTRYPDVFVIYTKEKTEEIVKLAKKVLKWIETNL